MRYGVYVPNFGLYGDPRVLRDLAATAEQSGWHGFFMYDLLTSGDFESPVADPWVALAAAAAVTSKIKLGPMSVPLPRRRPAKLALEARTLQDLSQGRLILGVSAGVSWDYQRFGEPAGRRELGARLDEGVPLLKALLSGESVTHEGAHYRAHDERMSPAEVPVWTTGFWPRRVPIRGAAQADGLFPQIRDPEHDFRLPTPDEIVDIRAEFGPGEVAIWSPSAEPSAELAADYSAAGVTWWFTDGSSVMPDELSRRISAGPPA